MSEWERESDIEFTLYNEMKREKDRERKKESDKKRGRGR